MAELNEKYSCGSDDITFCQDSLNKQCDKIKCFRHWRNILCFDIPHSFAYLKGTEYCPLKKGEEKC